MKRVLIDLSNNAMCDIVAIGAEFPVAPGLQWFAAPADVAHGTHIFSGGAIIIRPPKTPAVIAAENSAAARAELIALDAASIRDMRTYIASKPDAPQTLKDREALAVIARARL